MTRRFTNIEYIQGDCLKPEAFKDFLAESDAVIHTVGALLDGSAPIDYRKSLDDIQKGDLCTPINRFIAEK